MKKYLISGCVILAILLAFSWYKSCQESPKEAYWRGQFDILEQRIENERVESLKTIESLKGDIAAKDKDILRVREENKIAENKIIKKSKEVNKLKVTYRDLQNDTERIDNLTQQVVHWKEMFTISEQKCSRLDDIIFSLTEKYNTQLKITQKYITLYNNECKVSQVLTMRLDICTKRAKGFKFGSTIKSGIVLTLAGIIIYSLAVSK